MAIFNYTLPSGATFRMTAPDGTTQAEADKIFYGQVAAGTFVGYKRGDTLTHPQQAFTNFGLTRLQRDTAGVNDTTLLAVVNGLPQVAELPTSVTTATVQNPITTADYVQVNSNTTTGRVGLGAQAVGPLNPQQVQALMGQLATTVGQDPTVITQEKGIGKYGLNCQQLERAGLIKAGYCDRYCPVDTATQSNPDNFVAFMNSPSPWTGLNGVNSANDILASDATQNQIQQTLMQQSYDSLVAAGTIVPNASSSTNTTTTASTGQVYSNQGLLLSASALTIAAAVLSNNGGNALFSDFKNFFSGNSDLANSLTSLSSAPLGTITDSLAGLGNSAVATFNSAISSLETGAVGFIDSANATIQGGLSQLQGLANGSVSLQDSIGSALNGDIGALVTNSSKYGPLATQAWTGANSIYNNLPSSFGSITTISENFNLSSINASSLSNIPGVGALSPQLTSSLDSLGKASQFSVNFSDFDLSPLISSVQPAAGFTNQVNRATVDAAVNRVIGSDKITPPAFELPSLDSLGITADIDKAKAALAQVSSTSSSGFGSGISG